MALPRYPTEQFPFSHFLVSGGPILFASTHAPLRICLIYHHAHGEWLLPKGRKDRGESMPAAAVRETFEETGYSCELLPLDLITRAPVAGAQSADAAMAVGGSEEPFMVTLRRTKEGGIQILSWFATVCAAGADKVVGVPELQTEVEEYESAFFEVDEALQVATFQVDRDVIARAVELVRATYAEASDTERPQLCHSKL
ncbi:NUDIX hydrolase domain-like protein [Russula ochroleuca]|jgi:8-oxo-dGTP pyrophosphatase MutT (NUDIX family)|uniref:NUDIX hydrolase domain-like protein n=1 Tax=Russula ochroleuca TaxID=152965 RepID=A0A9P5N7A5_9AGAM|nr:NUDIX hydrolase domain-like protein [Russula ochroleuca]